MVYNGFYIGALCLEIDEMALIYISCDVFGGWFVLRLLVRRLNRRSFDMPKARLPEIEMMRGFAMLGVVAIHVFNAGIVNLPGGSSGNMLFNGISGFLQFSVPVFIIISAMMAAYTNADRKLNLGTYYLKKGLRVGVPYIFWTFFYLGLQIVLGGLAFSDFAVAGNWLKWFGCGKGYAHLYFMAVILQFYILFPLLFQLVKLVKDKPIWAFILALGPQIGIYWLNKLVIYDMTTYFSASFAKYYCIAFAGMWMGLNYHRLASLLARCWYWVVLLFAVTAGIFVHYTKLSVMQIYFSTFPMNLDYQFFCVSAALLFLWLSGRLVAHKSIIGKGLVWIGTYSFGIYLIHPMITYVFVRLSAGLETYPLLAVCILTVLLIEVVCGFVVKAMQAWNPTAYLFGAGRWKPKEKPAKVQVVDEHDVPDGMPEFAAPLKMPGGDGGVQELPSADEENVQDAEVVDIVAAEEAAKETSEDMADTDTEDAAEIVVDAEVVEVDETPESDADGADEEAEPVEAAVDDDEAAADNENEEDKEKEDK